MSEQTQETTEKSNEYYEKAHMLFEYAKKYPQKTAAFAGPALLLIGCFIPLASVSFYGDITYFNGGKGDGLIVVGLGIVSLFFAAKKKYLYLLYTGLGSLGMIAFTYLLLNSKLQEANSWSFGLASSFVTFKFGWLPLLTGAMATTWAGWKERQKNAKAK